MAYIVIDRDCEPEAAANAEAEGVRVVHLPLVRRSLQPKPSYPYGYERPLWVGHQRFGNHAVAYVKSERRFESLCGRSFSMTTFGDEIIENRCDACVSVAQPIVIRRLYAQRRGGEIIRAS